MVIDGEHEPEAQINMVTQKQIINVTVLLTK